MEICFKNKKLEKVLTDVKRSWRELGTLRGTLVQKRLAHLAMVDTLDELRKFPGQYHELVADRKGQWACVLDQPYRLIFEPTEKPIPVDKDGRYMWSEIKSIEIIEIVNYHGK